MKKVDQLALELAGDEPGAVPFESLVKIVWAMRGLLKSLDTGHTLDWQITELQLRNPVSMVTSATPVKEKWKDGVSDSFADVFRALNERRAPKGVSVGGVRYARTIMNALNDGISRVAFVPISRKAVVIEKLKLAETRPILKEAQQREEYIADVELTGILETATTALGNLLFYVRDPLTNHRTECDVPRALFNQALDAMKRDNPLVAVSGSTRYEGGWPVRMKVETFEVWPSLEEHPGLFAVQGIDITGGMDAVEYLRSIRGDT